MTIALWFCPQEGTFPHEVIKQLIVSLQTLFPASVVFEPHITITTHLGSTNEEHNQILTSCVAAIESIKSKLKDPKNGPLVSFDTCTIGKPLFKKVTLECKDNKFLLGLEKVMTEMYSTKKQNIEDGESNKFKPHLSLLYSDVQPISQAYVRMIEQRIEDALDLGLIPIDGSDTNERDPEVQTQWKFDRVSGLNWGVPGVFKIVKCEGPIDEWEVLGHVDV